MKRIMIVDDEFIMRIGIKGMIDWEANGYLLVGEAVDGSDAIGKLAALQPDIILTDLVMEPTDGLELIRYCAKHHPRIGIIVLSNYDDYENVKTAMKLGAKDYLLKLTTQPEQLLSILNEVSREIDAHVDAPRDADFADRNADLLRQRVLSMMLDPAAAVHADAICRDLRGIGSAFDPMQPWVLLALSITNFFLLEEEGGADRLFVGTLESAIAEIVSTHYPTQVFHCDRGMYIVMLNARQLDDERMARCFAQINTCVERYFGVSVSGCMSAIACGTESIPAAAESCQQGLARRFTLRENRLLYASDSQPFEDWQGRQQPLDDWLISLRCFAFDHSRAFLARMFGGIYDRAVREHAVRAQLYDLYHVWKLEAADKGIELDACVDQCGQTLYRAVFQYDLLTSIERSFLDVLRLYERKCVECGARPLNRDIVGIQLYVARNLKENVTSAEAARMLHMSESYFSRLFRRETGQRYVDYVNRLRIERSRELLRSTDWRISDIASEVGIDNANYFSVLFRRMTGVSPLEFRAAQTDAPEDAPQRPE